MDLGKVQMFKDGIKLEDSDIKNIDPLEMGVQWDLYGQKSMPTEAKNPHMEKELQILDIVITSLYKLWLILYSRIIFW